ncbi:Uncharacterised protein [Mycobacteroides abscessus subsp. abscessus]|nr:Uncharacterised protein [Mycobacteroides abscessus subsp. abscessus]
MLRRLDSLEIMAENWDERTLRGRNLVDKVRDRTRGAKRHRQWNQRLSESVVVKSAGYAYIRPLR